MKVLHYVPKFSVTSETFIYDQINELQNQGIDNLVVTSKRLNSQSRPFNNVKVIPLFNFLNDRITQKLAFGFEWLTLFINFSKWQKLLKAEKPDIIHCHTGNAAKTWFHIQQKLGLNIPVLVSLHGSDVNMEPLVKPKYKQFLSRAALQSNVLWTVPSNFLKEKAIINLSIPTKSIIVVHNGVNPLFFNEANPVTKNYPAILSIGRFIGCKGHKYLVSAFAEFLKEYEGAKLTLVGNGPLQTNLHAQVQELGLTDAVTIVSQVEHKDMLTMMARHNLYVQASIKDPVTEQEESFGVAALEALVSGLPVVVSNCGGLPEVVAGLPEEVAMISEQASPSSLKTRLTQLYQMTDGQHHNYRDYLFSKFSMANNGKIIKKIYSNMIN